MAKIPMILCRRIDVHIKTNSTVFITRLFFKGSTEESVKNVANRREEYPATEKLKLPLNVSYGEKPRFSKHRSRDICGTCIEAISASRGEVKLRENISEFGNYDCSGSVDLSSAMQTNVPYPFRSTGKPTHLNMPHGRWRQEEKYMSGELQSSHHANYAGSIQGSLSPSMSGTSPMRSDVDFLRSSPNPVLLQSKCFFSSEKEMPKIAHNAEIEPDTVEGKTKRKLSGRERLLLATKEYGSVIIVVHVTIALFSLGVWYMIIANGFDATPILESWGESEGAVVARTAAPLVVAYIVHKMTAVPRIGFTLGVTPAVVRYLRKKGILHKKE